MPLEDLRQLQKDLAKPISTHEERHATDARAKLDVIAEDIDFLWPTYSAPRGNPPERPPRRNTVIGKTRASPRRAVEAIRCGW
jgi:hypothetical protein